MIDVEIKNFQSIEHVRFKVQGYTALVGRSNIGKSAIVRAVKAALTGSPIDEVRHASDCPRRVKGAKSCKCFSSVHLRAEGFDLLWEKGDAINRYTFNGQVYDKAERGTPDFLQPAYAMVKVGDEKELLQVCDQFDPIFLLNQTGGVVADVLSDVAHLDRVNVAIRFAEKDRKEAASTRKVREQDVVLLTQRLLGFDGLESALATTRDVEDRLDALEAKEKNLLVLERFLERGSALESHRKALEEVLHVEAPAPEPLSAASKKYEQMTRFHTQVSERAGVIRSLQGVENIVSPDHERLRTRATSFEALDVWIARLRVFKAWMERSKTLEGTPDLQFAPLVKKREEYEAAHSRFERHRIMTEQYDMLAKQYASLETEGATLQAEWEALGICPTCTQPFHGEGHERRV